MKPRLLLLAVLALAAAIPVAASTASGAPERHAAAAPAILATAEHPVIDNDFLYKEEWDSSQNYVFRVGGGDGPPDSTAAKDNLPPNYNGANEFYAWWKSESTNTDDGHMGPMGRFLTAKDHFEACCQNGATGNQTFPFQLDDATVTIPGQTCPGQIVLIAGHNDSTPVSTNNNPAAGAQSGSATPFTQIRNGNWGNGSPYDADT